MPIAIERGYRTEKSTMWENEEGDAFWHFNVQCHGSVDTRIVIFESNEGMTVGREEDNGWILFIVDGIVEKAGSEQFVSKS